MTFEVVCCAKFYEISRNLLQNLEFCHFGKVKTLVTLHYHDHLKMIQNVVMSLNHMEMGIINDIISDINDQISFKGIPIISRTVSRTTLLKIQNMIEL